MDQSVTARQELLAQLNQSTQDLNNEKNQIALIRQKYKEKLTEFNGQLAAAKKEVDEAHLNNQNQIAAKDQELNELKTEVEKLNEKLQLYAKSMFLFKIFIGNG